MKIRRIRSHPDFKLEGRSKFFRSFWELELTPGEETSQHQHYDSEELIYLLSGRGTLRVAEVVRCVEPGEVVLVPARTSHVIANESERLVRAITVESKLDPVQGEPEIPDPANPPEERRSASEIDQVMEELPRSVDEAVAIKTILELFDIGGHLSEIIERKVGLESSQGLSAVREIERRIMRAVVEITGRYQLGRLGSGADWLEG